MNLSSDKQEQRYRIQKLQELPPLPLTAQEILRAVNNEHSGLDQIAAIIKRDPGLSARIIGLANSAFFGTSGIHTVEEAIIRSLGLTAVKNLSLSLIMGGVFKTDACKPFDLSLYWKTSLMSAYLSELLARKMSVRLRPDPKQAYLCGLLHNLGLLAMVSCFPEEMSQVFAQADIDHQCQLGELEHRHLGLDHHEAGAWLSRKWHLPDEVLDSIECRLDEEQSPQQQALTRLSLFVADWACRWVNGDRDLPSLEPHAALLGLDEVSLAEVGQRGEEKYDGLCELAACMDA